MKLKPQTTLRLGAAMMCGALMAACASIGTPQGGPRDEEPPVFVRAEPAPGALNVNKQRIDVWFDENIQLDDAFNKVIVSPTQSTPPTVRSLGKHLYVELRDTLQPDATYTIDFADAIKDLNEGNVLDGFALDFSTGALIDTLRISGVVLAARNLEPAQAMLVGIHSNLSDTALTTLPFDRVARTNQSGQFTLRNLKPGAYNVFAINDVNRDNRWDITEDIAFLGQTVSPYVEDIEVVDSLRTPDGRDSLVTRPGVAYLPNDVLLTWFNHGRQAQYLRDHERPERRRITLGMARAADSLPQVHVVGGALDGRDLSKLSVLQHSATNDTITYWLRDPEVLAVDSLRLSVRHEATDSLFATVWQTDTINFFWREPKVKKKKNEEADTVPVKIDPLSLKVLTAQQHDIYNPVRILSETPIDSVINDGIHLEMAVDTLWEAVNFTIDRPTAVNLDIDFDRKPGVKYKLTIDSAAVVDIYELVNKDITHEFTVRNLDEYANLRLHVQNTDSVPVMVELLGANDEPVRVIALDDKHIATFTNVNPGTYYARLWLDTDSNSVWTPGDVASGRQPEEVYYYPGKLELRANWDMDQDWDIYSQPLDAQKPRAILKNKPKLKKGESESTDDEETELDEWGEPVRRDSRKGSTSTPRLGGTGIQTNQTNINSIRPR